MTDPPKWHRWSFRRLFAMSSSSKRPRHRPFRRRQQRPRGLHPQVSRSHLPPAPEGPAARQRPQCAVGRGKHPWPTSFDFSRRRSIRSSRSSSTMHGRGSAIEEVNSCVSYMRKALAYRNQPGALDALAPLGWFGVADAILHDSSDWRCRDGRCARRTAARCGDRHSAAR